MLNLVVTSKCIDNAESEIIDEHVQSCCLSINGLFCKDVANDLKRHFKDPGGFIRSHLVFSYKGIKLSENQLIAEQIIKIDQTFDIDKEYQLTCQIFGAVTKDNAVGNLTHFSPPRLIVFINQNIRLSTFGFLLGGFIPIAFRLSSTYFGFGEPAAITTTPDYRLVSNIIASGLMGAVANNVAFRISQLFYKEENAR